MLFSNWEKIALFWESIERIEQSKQLALLSFEFCRSISECLTLKRTLTHLFIYVNFYCLLWQNIECKNRTIRSTWCETQQGMPFSYGYFELLFQIVEMRKRLYNIIPVQRNKCSQKSMDHCLHWMSGQCEKNENLEIVICRQNRFAAVNCQLLIVMVHANCLNASTQFVSIESSFWPQQMFVTPNG